MPPSQAQHDGRNPRPAFDVSASQAESGLGLSVTGKVKFKGILFGPGPESCGVGVGVDENGQLNVAFDMSGSQAELGLGSSLVL